VSLATELDDLDRIRSHFGFHAVAVLGHSWGGLLAMEYALRSPQHVSHLILMNTAPASHSGALAVRNELRRRRSPAQSERMSVLLADPAYEGGDIDVDLEICRIHFAPALHQPEQLERVVRRLRSAFTSGGIVTARAIEDRLYDQTWNAEDYDLLPRLNRLRIPSLIIHGDTDFVPVDVARQIADSIPGSRFVLLAECGHFAYLEQPDLVYRSIASFLAPPARDRR
jgi:proline-specific peptidase